MKMNITGKPLKSGKIMLTRDSNPSKSSDLVNQEQKMHDFLDNLANKQHQKMLREIANDDLTPKKHDFVKQNEIHEKIRNDEDYDDWDYGTEPYYGKILE
jgi:phosphopantothenoylcysteine synthetase/decarboxylase